MCKKFEMCHPLEITNISAFSIKKKRLKRWSLALFDINTMKGASFKLPSGLSEISN